jgi:mannose-6-phosphate isomerase-like protein (cupin superfamily)
MKRTIVNPVIKDVATFLRTAKESNAKLTEIEIKVMPGGGNKLHYHKTYSETFVAVEGELGIRIGKQENKILKPGEQYTVQPMQLHAFFNPGDKPVTFLVRIEPGHEGFENSLRILYGLAADGLTFKDSIPKNFVHTALILNMSDMNAPGLLTWIFPALQWIAKRSKGVEQRLISQYCVG